MPSDPLRSDLAGIDGRIAFCAFRPELGDYLRGEQIGDIFAKQLDVLLQRAARIISRKPRAHLFVGKPLQLSSLATHQSDLRSLALSRADRLFHARITLG